MSRTFYLIAIGGTAMTPLAGLLVEKGERVLGSDLPLYPPMSDRLVALGIEVLPGFDARNLPSWVDQVVVGNLAGKDNPELVAALSLGLPVASMPETLRAEFLAGRHPVVIAGTHGKTTTTALTAWLLAAAGEAPGYLVAGEPRNFPSPS
ncbi:MAG TPA: Mur ligase domain-containing protein, partial [Thermoanaerobaculia bacterium]|nr:Mur ligase domain-containing protein [Thermoanaerobaculia bacterium]